MANLTSSDAGLRELALFAGAGGNSIPNFESKDRKHMMTPILDACCGSKMMHYDKANPLVHFNDARSETIVVPDRTHRPDGTRTITIAPDTQYDFCNLPFPDDSFNLVIFDPPHLIRAGKTSWLAAKYGTLQPDWQAQIKAGLRECWRVLAPPLFGNRGTSKNLAVWTVFFKDGKC